MEYYENMSNNRLKNLSTKDLEDELKNYYLLLSTESFDNSIIVEKILFIQYLLKEKKNN
jgi:hypothetical protein